MADGPARRGPAGDSPLEDLSGWLRAMVWALGPVAPTTSVRPRGVIRAAGPSGRPLGVPITLVNGQGAAVSMVLGPSPMRSASGYVWYPRVSGSARVIVPAREQRTTVLVIDVPSELPAGIYCGTLPMLAMLGPEPDLELEVTAP